jgi:hypothetical protein
MMATMMERVRALYSTLEESSATPPLWLPVPADHISPSKDVGFILEPDESYFEIRVAQLYLPYDRQWFKTRVPSLLVISEFAYDGEPTAVPLVVGPGLIHRTAQDLPVGMVFADTRVAGPTPYRGDGLSTTLVLYSMPRDNYLLKLIDTLTSIGSSLDLSIAGGAYAKVAGVVLDQIKELGADALSPVVGYRKEFRPVKTGSFAIINQTERTFDPADFWVVDGQLHHGASFASAEPFREAEYVLFSIASVSRENLQSLPVYGQYREVLAEANRSTTEQVWTAAKIKLSDLVWQIHSSPDLTDSDKTRLVKTWTDNVVAFKDDARKRSTLAEHAVTPADEKKTRQIGDMLAVMKL